ncbi:MAG: HAD family phosphatase [Anaerorhabdus sp.]|uniref:HAD family hydrolase n=1 Tax=Anaerorhabdus sp. TaxID=1872524 RepID=UPI002B217EAE|nr:HAD family phosphatase [Anaerorhabdus sp.]MEA4874922.1 HAD family phosphatase [Anaerorhabdus sp.]
MIKAILFDMDGTLLDTEGIWNKAWTAVEEKYGFMFDPKIKDSFIGMPKQKMLEIKDSIIPSHLDYDEIQNFRVEFFHEYTSSHPIEIKQGAFECLNFLKSKGIKAIVCTSTYKERAIPWLKDAGLYDYFDDIVTGDIVKVGKPNPEIYEITLKKNHLHADECLAVEDTTVGVLAATGADLKTFYIKDILDISNEAYAKIYKQLDNLGEIIKEIGGQENE